MDAQQLKTLLENFQENQTKVLKQIQESADTKQSALQKAAVDCDFTSTCPCNKDLAPFMLGIQLVRGVADSRTREHLREQSAGQI